MRFKSRKHETKMLRVRFLQQRVLLAAVCCGLIGVGTARASTVTESTDFSNSTAGPTLLPAGTNQVIGTLTNVNPPADLEDDVLFTGIIPGTVPFSYDLGNPDNDTEWTFDITFYDANANFITSQTVTAFDSLTGTVGVVVPGDGKILLQTTFQGAHANYTLGFEKTFLQSTVPEPGSAAIGAIGVAALLTRRRGKTRHRPGII